MSLDSNLTPFLTLTHLKKLVIGSKLDHRDELGKFTYARVIDIDKKSKIKLHYRNFKDKYDKWYDYSINIQFFFFLF